ncbi:UDP-hydrolyzing UDP-N-acetyl-D-glucosamine 2-epimerase [Paenibacillus sp. 4624]|uniref:UDP-N-acetylglucosamine 2-epimerase (Hydrolyzing) n=1 Tax=Paenibacillus amylolyticus TaxID=1451 RepID=A0A5M9WVF8_PAEAM|nr:UDP-N-acetylglucosamine 2-epimerase [Paenibacillus amylolyticus]KAA8785581.1 UDP-N-acetylglucosamine 2-epimerase (hydrolyzing) [Paenibacillus amylolyticus]
MNRKICIVTGTRAEYGLLHHLMKRIIHEPGLELKLIVTGMHLSPEFGLTYKEIEEDGFVIDEKIEMLISGDSTTAITKSVGLGVISFADALERIKPDILLVLGDRFEIFAAAQAAMIMRIPIAHIHGGELTQGAIDDAIRHSITKMAHFHFTASEEYKNRVIQLGEQPETVYNVGALGIEGIRKTKCMDIVELSESIHFQLEKFFLVTLHPTTLEGSSSEIQIQNLLKALDQFPNYQILFTKTNADTDGRIINKYIEAYVERNPDRTRVYTSLGQVRYLNAVRHCEMVIGNSSSGLLESPVFEKPTINIGIRQQGRLKAASVIDCSFSIDDIKAAIIKGLSASFKEEIKSAPLLYGEGNTSEKIALILKESKLGNILLKKFYDFK